MKIKQGDFVEIHTYDTQYNLSELYTSQKQSIIDYKVGGLNDYKDRNPTIQVLVWGDGPYVAEFDIITGEHFVWGQGSSGGYSRDMVLAPHQLPIEWDRSLEIDPLPKDAFSVKDEPVSVGVLQKSFLERMVIWMLGKFR